MMRVIGLSRGGVSLLLGALISSGCTTFDIDKKIGQTNDAIPSFTQGELVLSRSKIESDRNVSRADEILSETINREDAVQLALVNSPGFQVMLANYWAQGADAARRGRIPNPVFAFERLAADGDAEVEFERMFAFGLVDLITLPYRQRVAKKLIEQSKLELASDVIDRVTAVRMAWVDAVAAQQLLKYAEQVRESASASAELARRMQSVGNFNRLERVRQQMFYADATTELALASHQARATREALVRLLGLNETQASKLTLPDRLPELPETPIEPAELGELLGERRFDIAIAKAELEAAARAQGVGRLSTYTDIEVGYRESKKINRADAASEYAKGYEIELEVPLFDWGDMRRAGMDARTLAAANNYLQTVRSVASTLRENYSAYRTSYDVSSHYRDEVLPLVQTISEENNLQYNGMLIGVFELLQDSRMATSAVVSAIDAQRQFWQAEAGLQAEMFGRSVSAEIASVGSVGAGGEEAH